MKYVFRLVITIFAAVNRTAVTAIPEVTWKTTTTIYHTTDDLIHRLRTLSAQCDHADAEWTTVTPVSSMWKFTNSASSGLPPEQQAENSLLTITITASAKARNEARRQGQSVAKRTTIVATFGEHGRELITSELALRILQSVCDQRHSSREAHSILNHCELVLIPVVNAAGRRAVESGQGCWRLNRNGVDLNRNYKRDWGLSDEQTNLEEEHAGEAPLSEFETRAIDAIVRRVGASGYVSVHSGDSAVIPPWDGRDGNDQDMQSAHRMAGLARQVARTHCGDCAVGRAVDTFDYRAYGTGVDHMVSERRVAFAVTVEIFGGDEHFCETMFNPTTLFQFESVMANWSTVLHTVAGLLRERRHHPHFGRSIALGPDTLSAHDNYYVKPGIFRQGYQVSWVADTTPWGEPSDVFKASSYVPSPSHGLSTRTIASLTLVTLTVPNMYLFATRGHRSRRLRRKRAQRISALPI